MAILLVILFHYRYSDIGWAGVQLFFVLSGYLITSILLREKNLNLGLYLKRFYWRRSLRIFPLYFAYLAIVAGVLLFLGLPSTIHEQWPYLVTYTSNFLRLVPGYQNNFEVGHFWSLAVEEQFYLLWPITVFSISPATLKKLCIVILILAPIVRWATGLYLSGISPSRGYRGEAIYALPFCQFDAFAIGALITFLPAKTAKLRLIVFGVASFLLIALGIVNIVMTHGHLIFTPSFGYPVNLSRFQQWIWGYSIIDLWCGSLIWLALTAGWFSNILKQPALLYIGKISYGLYVYHLIVQSMVVSLLGNHTGLTKAAVFVAYFAALILVAGLSYSLFEERFLRLKDTRFRLPRKQLVAGS